MEQVNKMWYAHILEYNSTMKRKLNELQTGNRNFREMKGLFLDVPIMIVVSGINKPAQTHLFQRDVGYGITYT